MRSNISGNRKAFVKIFFASCRGLNFKLKKIKIKLYFSFFRDINDTFSFLEKDTMTFRLSKNNNGYIGPSELFEKKIDKMTSIDVWSSEPDIGLGR